MRPPHFALLAAALVMSACDFEPAAPFEPPSTPPFHGTIFLDPDIITEADPTAFVELLDRGRGLRQMYDRRSGWVDLEPHLFEARFDDGLTIEMQVNPEFEDVDVARRLAQTYAVAIGRLPTSLRVDVDTSWIHDGVEPFGGGNRNLLIHVGQAELYVADGILEETLVHEAAHTSIDDPHAAAPGWLAAQAANPTFVSTYARDNPAREDIAESLLLWVALRRRAARVDAQLLTTIFTVMPNRLAYFDTLPFDWHPLDSARADPAAR